MKPCRFCGEKIYPDATECKHCGKSLTSTEPEQAKLTGLDRWESKTLPGWVMVVLILFGLFFLWLTFSEAFKSPDEKPDSTESESAVLVDPLTFKHLA